MAEELTQEGVEQIVEALPQITEGVQKISKGFLTLTAAISAASGAIAGYYVAQKRLESKYSKIAEEEIAEMRAHYLAKEKASAEKKPTIDEVMEEQGYTSKLEGPEETVYVKVEPAEDEPEVQNIFEDPWDYEEELKNRRPDVPYVIHKDEYFGQEAEYTQVSVTYYEGDDVLCDERDAVIEDQDATVGLGNLARFGHGSGDPNIVYVRNVELEIEYEIVHSDGKYAIEVHGFSDDELKHSDRIQRRHQHFDDE